MPTLPTFGDKTNVNCNQKVRSRFGEHVREIYGGEPDSTNNRMEIMAAIQALECLKRPCAVRLHTDSQYLRLGVTQWVAKWKRNGWDDLR